MKTETAAGTGKSVRYLKGIGPRRGELLQKLGVETIHDLCYFFPRRYEDRSHLASISEIKTGEFATIQGAIQAIQLKPLKRVKLLEIWVRDESGLMPAVWFNQAYLQRQFKEGDQIILSGKVDFYQGRLQMTSPEHELINTDSENPIHVGRITPIYPLTDGLFQRSLRAVMNDLITHHFYGEAEEHLPMSILNEYRLMNLENALREIHFPTNMEQVAEAKRRLIYDELFILELKLLVKALEMRVTQKSIPFRVPESAANEFRNAIPFKLTRDQEQGIEELGKDLSKPYPMHRLLQGEVGSGKTVVAAYALKLAAYNRIQCAILVPTEILAEQHLITLKKFLNPNEVRVELLTASVFSNFKKEALAGIETGSADVVVGTHALLQETVNFKNLGLVIIDEQHKFGVEQRALLLSRNPRPHLLIMSATPIPRTLGLTLFGDLNISTLKELPKGRKKIETILLESTETKKIYDLVRATVERGEQVYILYPLIEESDKLEAQAAKAEYESLTRGELSGISVGLLHGRIPKLERDQIMEDFRAQSIKVLIATTVVEVGVDNPNATLMIIHNADRFGLSQLHQIRGRIGRGTKKSLCVLVADPKTEDAQKRLGIMLKSDDGFEIAEQDLKLRGPGEFFGFKQSGIAGFKLADLVRDEAVLRQARQDAVKLLEIDPHLQLAEHVGLRRSIS